MNTKVVRKNGFALVEILLTLLIMTLLFSGFIYLVYKKSQELKMNFTERALDESQSNFFFHNFKLLINYPLAPRDVYNITYQGPNIFFPDNTQIIKATSRDHNGSDTILVRYHGNAVLPPVFSCHGVPLANNQTTMSLFYIHEDAKLACSRVENGIANMKSPNILIEDVEIMHILYGEDTDQDGVVNRYVSANSADLSLDKVISVKISLLIKTGETLNPLLASKYYQLDDIEFGPYTDHFARKVLTYSLPVNKATKHTP